MNTSFIESVTKKNPRSTVLNTSKSPNLNNSHFDFEFQRQDRPYRQQRSELRWCCVIGTIVDAALTHYKHAHSTSRSPTPTLHAQLHIHCSPRGNSLHLLCAESVPLMWESSPPEALHTPTRRCFSLCMHPITPLLPSTKHLLQGCFHQQQPVYE